MTDETEVKEVEEKLETHEEKDQKQWSLTEDMFKELNERQTRIEQNLSEVLTKLTPAPAPTLSESESQPPTPAEAPTLEISAPPESSADEPKSKRRKRRLFRRGNK